MKNNTIQSMSHPLRLKIVQEISMKGKATTKEIAELCGDIAQATLYRHLNALLKHGIIEVVSENKVRGTLEKVYSIKVNPQDEINKNIDKFSNQQISELFSQFVISLLSDFDHYLTKSDHVNIVDDKVGFRSYPLYLSDEEFMEMMGEIHTSISKRLENSSSPDRVLRKFSTVTTPYKDDRSEKHD